MYVLHFDKAINARRIEEKGRQRPRKRETPRIRKRMDQPSN